MANTHVALIRGINVGRNKRVAMADLRAAIESLGYSNVRTLLNSGNVVFDVPAKLRGDPGPKIETAMAAACGVSARVLVLSAADVAAAVQANPLGRLAKDDTRHMVTVVANPADLSRLKALTKQDWKPEALALGTRVAYLWCPAGILESPLTAALNRVLGDGQTMRNWATWTKLHAMANGG